jgi:hypothetical protein
MPGETLRIEGNLYPVTLPPAVVGVNTCKSQQLGKN